MDRVAGDVWMVMPTYDEAENLERIVAAARDRLPPQRRILIVDDNSPDGTGQIADQLAGEHDDVEVLHRAAKQGIGPAYISGFRRALAGGASAVVQMDADFSHDPAYLPELLAGLDEADLVIGSRYVDGGGVDEWGPLRRMISRGGSLYARTFLRIPIHDLTGGYKAMRRELLEGIDLDSIGVQGYAFQVELTYRALRAGFSVIEVPIVFTERREGRSKMSTGIVVEAALAVPRMPSRLR